MRPCAAHHRAGGGERRRRRRSVRPRAVSTVPSADSASRAAASALGVDVPQHHARAGEQHAFGGRVADALRAAGDDGDAAVQVELVHRASPFRPRPRSGRVSQSAMYWRTMSANEVSGFRPSAAARAGARAVRPVGDDAGDALVALEAHPRAHRRAGHLLERLEHLADRHVQRRQVHRRAAVEGLAAGLVDGDQRRRPCAPATTPGATPRATPGRSTSTPASGSRMMPLKKDEAAPLGWPGRTVTVISRAPRPSM